MEIVTDAVVQHSLEVLVMRRLIGVPLSELRKILLRKGWLVLKSFRNILCLLRSIETESM